MSRHAQFTRDNIISSTLEIIRQEGPEALSARNICKHMGSSVTPLFTLYKNMEEILADTNRAAEKIFIRYMKDISEYSPSFKEFGMRLVRFSREETKLYKYLFLDKNTKVSSADALIYECMKEVAPGFKISDAQISIMLEQIKIFTSGLALLSTRTPERYDDWNVSKQLSIQFTALQALFQSRLEPLNLMPRLKEQGERVYLRHWTEADAAALYKWASDPELGPRAGWPPHRSEADSLDAIRLYLNNHSTWAVILKDSDELIGCVGYKDYLTSNIKISSDEAEVGYWIAKPYWSQGLCTEALKLVIGYCRRAGSFRILWGEHFIDNPASGRVLEKCGFTDTGFETQCEKLQVGADKKARVLALKLKD